MCCSQSIQGFVNPLLYSSAIPLVLKKAKRENKYWEVYTPGSHCNTAGYLASSQGSSVPIPCLYHPSCSEVQFFG